MRRSFALRVLRSGVVFQPYNDTTRDRYPEVFQHLRLSLTGIDTPVIVSFGCSTGEEVFTLKGYLPTARLIGVDLSRANIRDCRRKHAVGGVEGIEWKRRSNLGFLAPGSVDAITCMAVLRHGDLWQSGAQTSTRHIPFARFAAAVADFDRCLRVGGLLAIEHSNFRFADTGVSGRYRTVLSFDRPQPPQTPLFGPDDRILPGAVYSDVMFEKREA